MLQNKKRNIIITGLISIILILLVWLGLFAQKKGASIKWEKSQGAIGYTVEIKAVNGKTVVDTKTNSNTVKVLLKSGNYKIRIIPINKFGNPEEGGTWQKLTLLPSVMPVIASISPDYFETKGQGKLVTVTGENFNKETKVYTSPFDKGLGKKSVPINFISPQKITFSISPGAYKPGLYTVIVSNPGDSEVSYKIPLAFGLDALIARNASFGPGENSEKNASLNKAVAQGNIQTLTALLKQGVDPNIPDSKGFYLVHYAAYTGNLKVLQLLQSYGAKMDAKDKGGANPIHHGAFKGHLNIVSYLVENSYNSPNAQTKLGFAPLDRAAINGKNSVVTYLIGHGAKVNHTFSNGESALHMAAFRGSLSTVKVLVETGNAKVNVQENRGFTPLHYAAWYGYPSVAEYLLSHGADKNIKSQKSGLTPYLMVQKSNHSFAVKNQLLMILE